MQDWLILSANFLQGCVPLLSFAAYIPQWKQLMETKSSRDISLTAWLMWIASSAFALFYAIVQYYVNGHGLVLVFSSVVALLFVLITVYLILIHRKPQ